MKILIWVLVVPLEIPARVSLKKCYLLFLTLFSSFNLADHGFLQVIILNLNRKLMVVYLIVEV